MVECAKWGLQEELDWCVWFVGKNKISLSPEFISEIRDNPALISKIFAEAVKLTIPQPKILPISPKDFDAAMGNLFSKKKFCDFTIVVRNVGVEVHTCVLASKWMFFSRILCREKNSVEHETPMPIETFQKLIKYFYTGDPSEFNFRDCGWILTCCEYYLLQEEQKLLEYCNQNINSQISDNNYFELIQLSMEIDNQDLKEKATQAISTTVFNKKQLATICVKLMEQNHYTSSQLIKTQTQLQTTIAQLRSTELRLSSTEERLIKIEKMLQQGPLK